MRLLSLYYGASGGSRSGSRLDGEIEVTPNVTFTLDSVIVVLGYVAVPPSSTSWIHELSLDLHLSLNMTLRLMVTRFTTSTTSITRMHLNNPRLHSHPRCCLARVCIISQLLSRVESCRINLCLSLTVSCDQYMRV